MNNFTNNLNKFKNNERERERERVRRCLPLKTKEPFFPKLPQKYNKKKNLLLFIWKSQQKAKKGVKD
ncbi:MAG: hypothetical protein MRECE_25c016 [Mycoplasmataceae bacterium CE_OT135]|nr:MAG: hypothetical protein MRECE_25c016 [Mycoplasmataceae bacterium CE_OT135]